MKRERLGLSSPSLPNTLSNRQRSHSRQKSTILTSMKRVRCVCQSSALKTGNRPQRLTKVRDVFMSIKVIARQRRALAAKVVIYKCQNVGWKLSHWWPFNNGSFFLFKSSRVSLAWWSPLSRNIHWGPTSQRNTAEIVQNSWRTQRSSRGNTVKSDPLTDDPKCCPQLLASFLFLV